MASKWTLKSAERTTPPTRSRRARREPDAPARDRYVPRERSGSWATPLWLACDVRTHVGGTDVQNDAAILGAVAAFSQGEVVGFGVGGAAAVRPTHTPARLVLAKGQGAAAVVHTAHGPAVILIEAYDRC